MYNLPKWSNEFIKFLSVTPQFAFKGNIHDVFPLEIDGNLTTLRLEDYLRAVLIQEGYEIILGFDPFNGFSYLHGDPDTIHSIFGDVLSTEKKDLPSIYRTIDIIKKSVENRTAYSAIILNHIFYRGENDQEITRLYYNLFQTCQNAKPRLLSGSSFPRYNQLIWIVDGMTMLPIWYTHDNSRIREISVPKPNMEVRRILLESLSKNLPLFNDPDEKRREQALTLFIQKTENLHANEIISIVSLLKREILPSTDISEAVTQFRSGFCKNPWRKIDQERMLGAEQFLSERVHGQKQVIRKVCDILNQTYLGLTRSQYHRNLSNPKSFFLFAGLEGVGKSTLAKAVSALIYGTDHAIVTLNMSDYRDEDAYERLTRDYEENGNYISKIQKNPYGLIVFENIESAHPSVLELLTTILRDGEIILENGKSVSFTEAMIICTLRLEGCCPHAHQDTSEYDEKKEEYLSREKAASEIITKYFLDNKFSEFAQYIREHIVVFRSIHQVAAREITKDMINRVADTLAEKHRIDLHFSPQAYQMIEDICCKDISRGGIEIGQRLDIVLISPLARALINRGITADEKIVVSHISDTESGWEYTLSGEE